MLFLNDNAVRYAPNLSFQANQKIIAIGPGTANALYKRGISVNALSKKYSSQSLLKLSILSILKKIFTEKL
ncbi:hypothetical protein [Candidatus Coxiella mudrowiae]|uniref:hypothetical protein n=1 Tax=Candidatus Coxiella mudrowiae TaxID=2054173 RepID=UPI00352DC8D2